MALWKKPTERPALGARVPSTGNGYTGGAKPKKVTFLKSDGAPLKQGERRRDG